MSRRMAISQARRSIERIRDQIRPAIAGTTPGGHGIVAAAQYLEGVIRDVIMRTFQGRTGNLARSFKTEFVELAGGTVSARVVSRLVYAGIQDDGGTIYPRRVSKLAIPIGRGEYLPVGTYARDVPGLTLIPTRSGDAILAKVSRGRGKARSIEAYFVLKNSVRLRGRQYLRTAEQEAAPGIERIMGDTLYKMTETEFDKG